VKEEQYPIDGKIDQTRPYMPIPIIMGLDKLNDMGSGIFLTINQSDGKGRKIENITKVRACFGDFDGTPIPKQWPIEPSMVVETSPEKYHAYFFTDDTPLEAFTPLQEGISQFFKSDPKVKDLARVLRCPGWYHRKGEPFLSRIIHHSGLKYSFGLLTEIFPPIKRGQWTAPKYAKTREFSSSEFTGVYGTSKGGRNCHLAKRVGGMIKRGVSWDMIEVEARKEAEACIPPLSERETMAVLKSLRRY
jgi:hypothetical protein